MKKNSRTFFVLAIILCIFVVIKVKFEIPVQKIYDDNFVALTSIDPQRIREFKLYPSSSRSHDEPLEFSSEAPITREFVQSLQDIKSSKRLREAEDFWRIEIYATGVGKLLRLACKVPLSNRNEMVICTFSARGQAFQSRLLYHWYRAYKELWSPSVYQQFLYTKRLESLRTLSSHAVKRLIISSGRVSPEDTVVEFQPPMPLLDDFANALTDVKVYTPGQGNPSQGTSSQHTWFLTVIVQDHPIQLRLSTKHDRMVGIIGDWESSRPVLYGRFESTQLINWYHRYRHQWSPKQDNT